MDIEEKYDLMKRDLDEAVKETDNLNEICCRLERENAEFHFENEKLKKLLTIAVEALTEIEKSSKDVKAQSLVTQCVNNWLISHRALMKIDEVLK